MHKLVCRDFKFVVIGINFLYYNKLTKTTNDLRQTQVQTIIQEVCRDLNLAVFQVGLRLQGCFSGVGRDLEVAFWGRVVTASLLSVSWFSAGC